MSAEGVVMIASGEKAESACLRALEAIRRHCPQYPLTVLNNAKNPLLSPYRAMCPALDMDGSGRCAKTRLIEYSPYFYTCYMDADTLLMHPQGISVGFELLRDGFDLVITPSNNQGPDVFWHTGEKERAFTFDQWGFVPVQLQAGVFWFQRTQAVQLFFAAWYLEWQRWRGQDQAAFSRALQLVPLKIAHLGRPFNGGSLVRHEFGSLR